MKHGNQEQLADERVYFILQHSDILHQQEKSEQKLQVGTWRKELKQEPWRDSAYFSVPIGLLGLLSYLIQDHLPWVGGVADNGLGLPTIKKMHCRLAYRQPDVGVFLKRGSSSQLTVACVLPNDRYFNKN